eukprot:3511653-Rhodomonas_salina.1
MLGSTGDSTGEELFGAIGESWKAEVQSGRLVGWNDTSRVAATVVPLSSVESCICSVRRHR